MTRMNDRGFVRAGAMETLIIAGIIGIIAAIAIPQIVNYKNRPLNEEAKAHAYQAYEAAQAYFRANPRGQPTDKDLEKFGYRSSPDILVMVEGGKDNLVVRTEHMKGRKAYRINEKGELLQ
jgi:type II secretory pathway pseudopilin PulG